MWDVLRREMMILLHERRMVLFVLMGAASAYALLIGNLYQGQIVQRIPVVVCDLDDSSLSRQLIGDISNADQYKFIGTVADEPEAMQLLTMQKASVAVIIPKDFARHFQEGSSVNLSFVQNGSNTLEAGYAAAPMQLIWSDWVVRYRAQADIIHGNPELSPAALNLNLRYTGNPVQGYLVFYIYGVMLMAAQIGITMSYALAVQTDVLNGYYQRHGIICVTLAKNLLYWTLSFSSVLLGILVLAGFFDLPFYGSMLKMLFICGIFLFAVENIAGLAGRYFRTKLALVQCLVFYALPSFLLSGYIWPNQGMVGIVNWISCLQPVHYVLMDFRQLALTGAGSNNYWQNVMVLSLIGLCGVIVSCLWIRYKGCWRLRKS